VLFRSRGGENISPVEVETALSSHPDVVECAVAPVPDPDLQEEIKAYVVLRAGVSDPGGGQVSNARALASFLEGRIARFKVPRYWEFRNELPHTPSEKVAKQHLEDGRGDWRTDTVDLRGRR